MSCCQNHPHVETNLAFCSRCRRPFCPDCCVELKSRPYCADCKTEHVLDVLCGASETELDLAPMWKRAVASMIDTAIYLVVAFILVFALMLAGSPNLFDNAGDPVKTQAMIMRFNIPLTLALALYSLVYEGLMLQFRGQTVGKIVLRIKVVTPEGMPISPGQAWGRTGMRVLFFNLLSVFGSLINYCFAFGRERTCIHDMVAKTRVVNWGS